MQSFPCHNDQFAAQISLIFFSQSCGKKKQQQQKTNKQLMNRTKRDSGLFVAGGETLAAAHLSWLASAPEAHCV